MVASGEDDTQDGEGRALPEQDHGSLHEGASLGRYVLVRALGSGGMGEVWLARDPELGRSVAIKLLHADLRHRDADRRAQARILREAQALAQLSHPNVVAVHDVGLWRGRVFMAMEFVRGQTLRTWLRAGTHAWRELVAVLLEAGRGLEAAHELGIIHRDFKPDNVMLDDKRRVRVLDFGLAFAEHGRRTGAVEAGSAVDTTAPTRDALGTPLTREGAVVGTPAYMPPEQLRGERTGPAADQFSFCVVLFEALHGTRPFHASSYEGLLEAIARGPMRPSGSAPAIPHRLRAAIERGLEARAEARFSSMAMLLAELEAVVRPRQGARALVAGVALASTAATAMWWFGAQDRCGEADTQFAGAWSDALASEIGERVAASPLVYVAASSERVVADLQGYADGWRELDRHACLGDDGVPEVLRRAQAGCIVARRRALAAVADALAHGEAASVAHAIELVASLPPLASCADATWLAAAVAPPDDPKARAAIEELGGPLARAAVLEHSGSYDEALALTDELATRAEELDHAPFSADVAYQRARLLSKRGELDDAEREFTKAFDLAMAAGADRLAGNVASQLVYLVGYQKRRHDEGLVWGRQAQALLQRVDAGPSHRAELVDNLGIVAAAKGQDREAMDAFREAITLWEDGYGPDYPELATPLAHLGIVQRRTGDLAGAEHSTRRALEIEIASLGASHPGVGATHALLGSVLQHAGKYDEARSEIELAIEIQTAALGPDHPDVSAAVVNLGNLERKVGDDAGARTAYLRALAIRERAFPPGHPDIALVHHNLATVLGLLGDPDGALRHIELALEQRRKALGDDHVDVASSRVSLADQLVERGRTREALVEIELAIAIYEKVYGRDNTRTAGARGVLGEALFHAGRAQDARAVHEAALAATIAAGGEDGPDVPDCQVQLALVLAELGDLDGALALLDRAVAASSQRLGGDNPRTLDARLRRAWVRRLREPESALDEAGVVVALLERDGESPPAAMRTSWTLLADIALSAGATHDAERGYQRVLAVAGSARDTVAARLGLAELDLRRLGLEAALVHVDAARAALPGEPSLDLARIDAWLAAHPR